MKVVPKVVKAVKPKAIKSKALKKIAKPAKFYKKLGSWDKFMFVYPFNKFVAIWGKPLVYNKNKSLSQNISIIQNELHRVTMLSKNL